MAAAEGEAENGSNTEPAQTGLVAVIFSNWFPLALLGVAGLLFIGVLAILALTGTSNEGFWVGSLFMHSCAEAHTCVTPTPARKTDRAKASSTLSPEYAEFT